MGECTASCGRRAGAGVQGPYDEIESVSDCFCVISVVYESAQTLVRADYCKANSSNSVLLPVWLSLEKRLQMSVCDAL